MNNFELLESSSHERQTIKERIDEVHTWLVSFTDQSIDADDIFSKPLSLKRSKLDEQIIHFRQFHAQLRTRRHSFDSEISTSVNLDQMIDENDRQLVQSIDKHFQLLDQQANQYNERINRLSTRLNEFHLEHAHLVDDYTKRLRLYREHLEHNDDINFSTLELLLDNDNENPIDHTLYKQLLKDLLETDHVEDAQDIDQCRQQLDQHQQQYENFHKDLKSILQHRQKLLNEYELTKTHLHEWLTTTDRVLKQHPNELTIERCQQLLIEHSKMPIDALKSSNQQLIHFYSSNELSGLYKDLQLEANTSHHSNTTSIFQRQTDDLIENHRLMKERLIQHIAILEKIQLQRDRYQLAKEKALSSIELAKELVTLEENTILPLDNGQIEIMLQKYKVHRRVPVSS